MLTQPPNRRILLVDDAPAIHEDFCKLLPACAAGGRRTDGDLDDLEARLFGTAVPQPEDGFELDSAYQGREALAMVRAAVDAGRPYAMAFVDMRMPPGWDGVETVERMWQVDPRLQVVICTAFSDHSWNRVLARLDTRDRLLILKKPFDGVEVCQFAATLTAKWNTARRAERRMRDLEQVVHDRTAALRDANEALRGELAERRRTAAELTVAASVFHHARDGILIIGPDSRVISVNPAFTAITGYRAGDAIGRPARDLWGEYWRPGAYQEMLDRLVSDGGWEGEIWGRRRSGERLLLRIGVSRVDDGGRFVCIFHDITELRRKDQRIRHLAFHDHLTGLPNQSQLIDRINETIELAGQDQSPFGVFFIDLDQFKIINDSYGHDVGNKLLKEVANRLRSCVRRSDMVARIGGDEFVVLLARAGLPDGYTGVAKKIINRLSLPARIAGRDVQVGVSIGIASFPEDGTSAIELMKHADAAMYAAKSAGRGTFRMFQSAMSERIEQRLRLEMDLRSAVRDGELELRYQPKIDLVTGALIGLEALVRWRHRRHGLLPPAAFLPLAEEVGLAGEVTDWVFAEVFRQSQTWRAAGMAGVRIAVNISVEQVQRGDLVATITRLADRHEFPLDDLEIELTEDGVMADPEAASAALGRLRALGISIAVDDFGTGYSSLAYLHRLPIDVLKIDKSFVTNADGADGAGGAEGAAFDAEIVRTIVGLGRTLKLMVVAEGVETDAQAEFLRSCGCSAAQGYLFAQPLTATETQVWLRQVRQDNAQEPVALGAGDRVCTCGATAARAAAEATG